ncbi:PREDICTED: guanine nucleotide-binding protein subunit alpha homolog isoform X1 [Diuraphis noxia]|uniref:guanine nucleotide-binding protein subunit alpha homolog isoform X1 n=1 Tax=Diuraphis noxia TaxID=143948 RepID=UPI000763612F|nr:PREDICTED: guanine nucleotide-binding protein subunit alpha homolog isoform X1 [Diuraphis noxia]XP_015375115.1 PREDICTED: guanine nucleotide-binding protein subunit alpha homolog isoform X1 [Diuraphis noxia]
MARCTITCPCCLRFKFSAEEVEQRYRSKEIDKLIDKDKHLLRRQVKLLLLGAGESGKSTFLKQMRIIHGIHFEPELVIEYQHIIYQNILRGMKVLADARQKLGIPWENPDNNKNGEFILSFDNRTTLDTRLFQSYAPSMYCLWKDAAIKRAFERRREFQLSDSVQYFLDNIENIARSDYLPTNKDILHARRATKGIYEFTIPINNIPFRFVDVGGQRSQRQKWFQCFDSVTSILFLVSSSEFDQVLVEDRKTNRLEESKDIFDSIVNNVIFRRVSIILFMNKTDLLADKLERRETNIKHYFPNFAACLNYLLLKYEILIVCLMYRHFYWIFFVKQNAILENHCFIISQLLWTQKTLKLYLMLLKIQFYIEIWNL